MKATVERTPGSQVVLHVELSPEELEGDVREACRRLGRQVRIPGFRPGRAPDALVQRVVGRERILQEAAQRAVGRAYQEAVAQQGLQPVAPPAIEIEPFEDGQALRFVARVAVRPEVDLGDWRSVRVAREVPPVLPEDAEAALADLQRARGTWVPTDEPVQTGHLVVLKTEGSLDDGRPISEDGLEAVVGAGQIRPEVEQAIRGLTAGGSVAVEFVLPPDGQPAEVAGRTARVVVTVLAVKRQELPSLEEVAREVVGQPSVEALRAEVVRRLEAEAARRADQAVVDKAFAEVLARARCELPDVLVDRGVDLLLDDLRAQLARQGTTLEAYLAAQGRTLDSLREEWRPAAEQRVRTEFVVDKLAEEAGLEPTQEELEEELRRLAALNGQSPAAFRRTLARVGQEGAVRYGILRRRVARLLLGVAQGVPWEQAAAEARSRPGDAAGADAGPGSGALALAEEGEARA
jgi:trigger factor